MRDPAWRGRQLMEKKRVEGARGGWIPGQSSDPVEPATLAPHFATVLCGLFPQTPGPAWNRVPWLVSRLPVRIFLASPNLNAPPREPSTSRASSHADQNRGWVARPLEPWAVSVTRVMIIRLSGQPDRLDQLLGRLGRRWRKPPVSPTVRGHMGLDVIQTTSPKLQQSEEEMLPSSIGSRRNGAELLP